MILSKDSKSTWIIFDEEKQVVVAEKITASQVADIILKDKKAELIDHINNYKPEHSYTQILFMAGRLECCDCGATLDSYNEQWPLNKQRCKNCLESY